MFSFPAYDLVYIWLVESIRLRQNGSKKIVILCLVLLEILIVGGVTWVLIRFPSVTRSGIAAFYVPAVILLIEYYGKRFIMIAADRFIT